MTTEETAAPGNSDTAAAPSPEQQQANDKQAQQDLEAGFNEAQGKPSAEAPAKTETPAAPDSKAAPAAEKAPAKTETPAEKKARLSDDQLQEMYEKVPGLERLVNQRLQQVFGKFGDLERKLQDIQKGKPTRKFTVDGFKRLKEEFPEIAQMLVEDLNESMTVAEAEAETQAKAEPKTEQPAVDVNKIVADAVAEAGAKTEIRILTVLHPDWQTIVKSEEFAAWMQTLSPEDAKKYGESDDAFVTAEAFTKFKAYKPAAKPPKPSAQKTERLENAITPDGDGAPPTPTLDDNAAFVAGFNSVRGGAT